MRYSKKSPASLSRTSSETAPDSPAKGKIRSRKKPVFLTVSTSRHPHPLHKGFDPEMVYVECGRCGAPVIWEPGKSSELFRSVGIDPLELDPSCLLISDGCPLCSSNGIYKVQVARVTKAPSHVLPARAGRA